MSNDARNFIVALGGYKTVAIALKKRATTVHTAMQSGVFPAAWYDALCKLAVQAELGLPERSLFSFLQLTKPTSSTCETDIRGGYKHEQAS